MSDELRGRREDSGNLLWGWKLKVSWSMKQFFGSTFVIPKATGKAIRESLRQICGLTTSISFLSGFRLFTSTFFSSLFILPRVGRGVGVESQNNTEINWMRIHIFYSLFFLTTSHISLKMNLKQCQILSPLNLFKMSANVSAWKIPQVSLNVSVELTVSRSDKTFLFFRTHQKGDEKKCAFFRPRLKKCEAFFQGIRRREGKKPENIFH